MKATAAQTGHQPKHSHKTAQTTSQLRPRRSVLPLICFLSLFSDVLARGTLPSIFSSFCFNITSAGERPWRPSHETKSFTFDFVLYGRLLYNNSHRCESLADLSYPVVLLQSRKSRSDRFIESLRGNLYGVLNVSKIPDRNRARSKNHVQERNIFAFCSPARTIAILQAGSRGVISSKPVSGPLPSCYGTRRGQ